MIQLLLNKTTPPLQLLPMPLITHSLGNAFTVSEKSSNSVKFHFSRTVFSLAGREAAIGMEMT